MLFLCCSNNQNVQMGGTVSTVANNAQDIVETAIPVITWLVCVTEGVILDGQGLSVSTVNKKPQKDLLNIYNRVKPRIRADQWKYTSLKTKSKKKDKKKTLYCSLYMDIAIRRKGKYISVDVDVCFKAI